jgi:hypothetical protein
MTESSTIGPEDPRLDRLFELLPAIHRIRDAEQGGPLQALLRVIAEQVNLVEEDIGQLYENWFIETCADWVVPYLGDLIGYRLVQEAGEPEKSTSSKGTGRARHLIPRREVANTVRYRRRKGTLALLELLANDVAGWPSRAVEFYKLLGRTQAINYPHPERGRTVDLRDGAALDVIDGPFNRSAHTVDVRRINSAWKSGRYNLPSVGVFVWNLKSYSVTRTPAYRIETPTRAEQGDFAQGRYTFSVLGNDTPLYARPTLETDPTTIAQELNLPTPIRRRSFEERGWVHGKERTYASPSYYGWHEGSGFDSAATYKSLAIWAPGWPRNDSPQPILYDRIIPADLSHWAYRPRKGRVAVDPMLGRIVFPEDQEPENGVEVYYHYGFSAGVGGGEYERRLSQPEPHKLYRVGRGNMFSSIGEALRRWEEDAPAHAVIEITDSGVYREIIRIAFKLERQTLQLRAANRVRPIIRLLDYEVARTDFLVITGYSSNRLVLDGLLITGRGLKLNGDITQFTLRHSTLVPGWSLEWNSEPVSPGAPSLLIHSARLCIDIQHSIVGTLQVKPKPVERSDMEEVADDEAAESLSQEEARLVGCHGIGRTARLDPIRICISDSILDAGDTNLEALGAPGCRVAHAILNIRRSTVFGQVQVHVIDLAENSIFDGLITVARRQHGCLRFCCITPDSRTPMRYNCQPDSAERAAADEIRSRDSGASAEALETEIAAAQQREQDRLIPQFNSKRYGTPSYCQLAETCAEEITRGADDRSEMGAFHDLYQPQRTANLRTRLNEYTPAGAQVGILFAS